MSKPWARYEIGFINHDKFRAIPGNAICLWLEGKNYADTKHTDGLLPAYEAKHWRFFSKKNVDVLTASLGQKPGTDQTYAPLWEAHAVGWKMHDYLDHNPCREDVLARIDAADQRRDADKARKASARAAKEAKSAAVVRADIPADIPADNHADTPADTPADCPRIPHNVRVYTDTDTEETRDRAHEDGDRVAALVERYPKIYAQCRSGATYRVREARDFEAFQQLVSIEQHDGRLDRLLELFFTVKARDFLNVPGTPRQFLHMLPECDRLLRERGL